MVDKSERDAILNRKRIQLEYLKKFIDNYLQKATYQKEEGRNIMVEELRKYRASADPDIKQVAKEVYRIYEDFLNYSPPKVVNYQERKQLNELIDKKLKHVVKKPEIKIGGANPSVKTTAIVRSKSPAKVPTKTTPQKKYYEQFLNNDDSRYATLSQLDRMISRLDELDQTLAKGSSNPLKGIYKGAKKRTLNLLGKEHTTKQEISRKNVQGLRRELLNIAKASENTNPEITTAALLRSIQNSLQKFDEIESERTNSRPHFKSSLHPLIQSYTQSFQFPERNILNKAFDQLIKHINQKYGPAYPYFQKEIDVIGGRKPGELNNDPKGMYWLPSSYKDIRTQDRGLEFKVGDFLALAYALSTEGKRDQLVIDARTYFHDNTNSELKPLTDFIAAINYLRQTVELLMVAIAKNVEPASLQLRYDMIQEAFDIVKGFPESQQLKDPLVKSIIEKIQPLEQMLNGKQLSKPSANTPSK